MDSEQATQSKRVWNLKSVLATLALASVPVLVAVMLHSMFESTFKGRTARYVQRLNEFYECQATIGEPCVEHLPGAATTEDVVKQIGNVLNKVGPAEEWRIVGTSITDFTGSATMVAEVRRGDALRYELWRIHSLNVEEMRMLDYSQVSISGDRVVIDDGQ